MSDELVVVKRFGSLMEATVARSALASEGIQAFLPDENWLNVRGGGSFPSLGDFSSGVVMQVASKDVDAARLLLDASSTDVISQPGMPDFVQPICPDCDSKYVELWHSHGLKKEDGSPIDPDAEVWRCKACHCVWSDEEDTEPEQHA
jgi:hypothetical protein